MKSKLWKSMILSLIIIIPFLFSYAISQQMQTESEDADFYNKRGFAFYEKGQYDQATSDFNKALEINPRYAGAYYNRGLAYLRKGLYDQAISDFTKAIEINPNYGRAYYNRGRVYHIKGEAENKLK
jgi:tetratricopeptide (TPR) repeat protein